MVDLFAATSKAKFVVYTRSPTVASKVFGKLQICIQNTPSWIYKNKHSCCNFETPHKGLDHQLWLIWLQQLSSKAKFVVYTRSPTVASKVFGKLKTCVQNTPSWIYKNVLYGLFLNIIKIYPNPRSNGWEIKWEFRSAWISISQDVHLDQSR